MALRTSRNRESGTSGRVRASVNNNNMEDVLKPPTIRRHTSLQLFLTQTAARHADADGTSANSHTDDASSLALRCRHRCFRPKSASRPSPAVVNTCGSHLLLRNGFTTRSSGQDVARIHHQLWSGDRGEHHNTHQNKATAGPVLIRLLVHPRQTLPGILHKSARCEHSVPVPQAEPIALQAVVARASRSYCRRPQGAPSRLL